LRVFGTLSAMRPGLASPGPGRRCENGEKAVGYTAYDWFGSEATQADVQQASPAARPAAYPQQCSRWLHNVRSEEFSSEPKNNPASRDLAILSMMHEAWTVQGRIRTSETASRRLKHACARCVQKFRSNASSASGDESSAAGSDRKRALYSRQSSPAELAATLTSCSGSKLGRKRAGTSARSCRWRTSGTWAGSTRPGSLRRSRKSRCSIP
jgi:hypothetical protein